MCRRITLVALLVIASVAALGLGLVGCGTEDSPSAEASPMSADVESLILEAAEATAGDGSTLKMEADESRTLTIGGQRWTMQMDLAADIVAPSTVRMTGTMQGGSGEPVEIEVLTLDGKTLYGRVPGVTDWTEAPAGSMPGSLDIHAYYAALPGATKEVDNIREETFEGVACTVVQLEIDLAALIEAAPSAAIGRDIFDAAGVPADEVDQALTGATMTTTLWIGAGDNLIYRDLETVFMTLPGGGKFSSRDDAVYSAFGEEIVPPIEVPKTGS